MRVSWMQLDPLADPGRRVWMDCTPCGSKHGLYMLTAEPRFVWVQCGSCFARYWVDTGVGKGGRPASADALPYWPC